MPRAHATLAALALRASLSSLAEAGAPDDTTVDDELLAEAIAGEYDTGRTQTQRDAGDAAVARLQRTVDDANTEVDSYLTRYPNLETTDDLAVYALDIARYRILGGESGSERYVRYQAALRYLRDVASGLVHLDLDEDETGGQTSGARFSASKPQFKRENLAGL